MEKKYWHISPKVIANYGRKLLTVPKQSMIYFYTEMRGNASNILCNKTKRVIFRGADKKEEEKLWIIP